MVAEVAVVGVGEGLSAIRDLGPIEERVGDERPTERLDWRLRPMNNSNL